MPSKKETGFALFRNTGFHITFENGCTVSVQFGPTHYCDNRSFDIEDLKDLYKGDSKPCANAEIAAWDKNGNWIKKEDWGDDVEGWQTPAQVLEFMNYVAAYES